MCIGCGVIDLLLLFFDLWHRRQRRHNCGLSKKVPRAEKERIFYTIIIAGVFFSAMFSRFMNTGSQFVMEGVKNLVVGNKVS